MADQLSDEMANLRLAAEGIDGKTGFAKKLPHGTSGRPTEILTNAVKIEVTKNVPVYKYDISIKIIFTGDRAQEISKASKKDYTQHEKKNKCVTVYDYVTKTYSGLFVGKCYYNRQAALYSLKELPIGEEGKQYSLPLTLIGADANPDARDLIFAIKPVTGEFQATTNSLLKAANPRADENDATILEAYNIMISGLAFNNNEKFITYGNSVHYLMDPSSEGFSERELPSLDAGKYMGVGVDKSVKVFEGSGKTPSLYAVIEVKKTSFHYDKQNMIDKIKACSDNIRLALDGPQLIQYAKVLKGLQLRLTYQVKQGHGEQIITFGGFGPAPSSPQSTFQKDGEAMTVQQYYKKVYNISLKYPAMPTIYDSRRRTVCYPAELLEVCENQRVKTEQLQRAQQEHMTKLSAALPTIRLAQSTQMKKALGLEPNDSGLKQAALNVSPGFEKVVGRVLDAPVISYANGTSSIRDNHKWQSMRFIKPVQLSDWVIFTVNIQDFDVRGFVDMLKSSASKCGIQMNNPDVMDAGRMSSEEMFRKAKELKKKFAFCIVNDSNSRHAEMKYFEQKYQIISQEMRLSTCRNVVNRNQHLTLINVLAKVNVKLGGLNYNIQSKYIEAKRLIIGIKIDIATSDSDPTVIGYTMNTEGNPCRFIGGYYYTKHSSKPAIATEEVKRVIAKITEKAAARFIAVNKSEPTHVMIYVNGVSEGQYSVVVEKYVPGALCALRKHMKTKPKFSVLVASIMHTERFFKTSMPGNKAVEQNIPAGVCIDSVVVNPMLTEFFINAHSAFQGTAKTPKIALLYDTAGMPIDVVQEITYHLCFLHQIVAATVSLPAPLMIAEDFSERGKSNYFTWLYSDTANRDDGQEIDCDALNRDLTYDGKALDFTRFTA